MPSDVVSSVGLLVFVFCMFRPPRCSSGKVSALKAVDLGSIPACAVDLSPGGVISVT